ncbi:hypothetical protein AB0F88_32040 [Streptosporangium sp. NPDC023963]|uniref:hypothetical protein n=1 Tax=Streptosporangium sp. NPDC023963 TaxID=3155608 RepID=UPI003412A297
MAIKSARAAAHQPEGADGSLSPVLCGEFVLREGTSSASMQEEATCLSTQAAATEVVSAGRDTGYHLISRAGHYIAARLVLSPRTVSAHLYRVFPKPGINSRAALRDALTDRQRMTPAREVRNRP